jgi:oxaloacetate decarboxylase beta subunit
VNLLTGINEFIRMSGFAQCDYRHIIMILVGLFFIYLAIAKDYEPLLLLPIGFGILVGNIPFLSGMNIGIYEEGSVLNYLYAGVTKGIYPPLIFLGIGAMTDFSAMLSNPKLVLLGAAAQVGIFLTLFGALFLGFNLTESAAIGIIGGASFKTCTSLYRSNCYSCLFLYGSCACDPASYYEIINY